MAEVFQKCEGLLRDCQNHLISEQKFMLKKNFETISLKRKQKNTHSVTGISPQQAEDNARTISKMRKRYIKKERQASIKKTNLGEDQLTFTPEQYARLQMIDECQEKGIHYIQKIDQVKDYTEEKQSAVERLKKLGQIDQAQAEVKRHLDWGDLSGYEDIDSKGGSASKKKGFQKRNAPYFRFTSNNVASDSTASKSFAKKSLNQYYLTILNKKTFGKKEFLMSNFSSAKHTESLSFPQKFQSINQTGSLSFAQKIEIIKDQAARSSNSICKNSGPFMTNLRREAIYSCQVLRYAKKILQPSQFQNLQLGIEESENSPFLQQGRGEQRGQNQQQSCQAKEILEKNLNRIKAERKRVIQKMVC